MAIKLRDELRKLEGSIEVSEATVKDAMEGLERHNFNY